jgi:signal transduction histidine kinase
MRGAINGNTVGVVDRSGDRPLHGVRTDGVLDPLLAERERVARDLHDGVVQEVFATAMALAALRPLVALPVQRRLDELIDLQDAIVQHLRCTVFGLRPPLIDGDGARASLEHVCADAEHSLGFHPALHIDGPVDQLDSDPVLGHLLLAFREVLSNVARHAHAATVDVSVQVSDADVELRVADDGRGMDPATAQAGDGLANLDRRARGLGGWCIVESVPGDGTAVTWHAARQAPSNRTTSSSDT